MADVTSRPHPFHFQSFAAGIAQLLHGGGEADDAGESNLERLKPMAILLAMRWFTWVEAIAKYLES